MKQVVSFSTGLLSAIVAARIMERYGEESTLLVFMDTQIEDADNYRFMEEFKRYFGIPIVILSEGRTPYQVARDAQIIPNHQIAPCTFKLKIDIFKRYLASLEDDFVIHIGYDFQEMHRVERTKKQYESEGWAVDFPMLWKPIERRKYTQVAIEDWGIKPPRMYALGYSHANCGGVCVKQGMGDWRRTIVNFPDRYAEVEQWEAKMRNHPVRKDYAIIRDRSGGKTTPVTLTEFRERTENSLGNMFSDEFTCVSCGIGDLVNQDGDTYATSN